MGVRAKFEVQSVAQVSWSPTARIVRLSATSKGDKNGDWAKYTPSGTLEMQIDNPSAAEWFTLGKAVYLDFTEAES